MKATFAILFAALAISAVSAQCNTADTKVPKNKRKKNKNNKYWRMHNKYKNACLAINNDVAGSPTCVWNMRSLKCENAPGCVGYMMDDCNANGGCLWRPSKKGKGWYVRNWRNRRIGACVDKPAGYDQCECQWKFKSNCQAAGKCVWNKKKAPGAFSKCTLRTGADDGDCGPVPTSSPTSVCNPNECTNTLICDDGASDTNTGCCSGPATVDWGFCGGTSASGWTDSTRSACPRGWARCNSKKCVTVLSTCSDFGGVDVNKTPCPGVPTTCD